MTPGRVPIPAAVRALRTLFGAGTLSALPSAANGASDLISAGQASSTVAPNCTHATADPHHATACAQNVNEIASGLTTLHETYAAATTPRGPFTLEGDD